MDALECIITRRSIRRFLDIPVDQETVLTVVEAGIHAPSSGNLQDWRFVVVDDKSLMKKICEYSMGQEPVHNAAFLIIVCADADQTERHYGLRGQRLYTVQNCAAASQNMLLAAHAIGLGGVWIGAFDEDKIRNILGIPSSVRPQAVLAFGYPAETPDSKTLRELSLVTFFNSYGLRIKNVHRLLNDYHVDWEKRISKAHTAVDRIRERAIEASKNAGEKVKTKGESSFHTYKKRIMEKIDSINSKKKHK